MNVYYKFTFVHVKLFLIYDRLVRRLSIVKNIRVLKKVPRFIL
jgi:hypothetical protein